MQKKAIAVLPVVLIMVIAAIASIGAVAVVKNATPSVSSMQEVQTASLCSGAVSPPSPVTVNVIKNGTWTATVVTAQHNIAGNNCGGIPQQTTFGYSNMRMVVLSASNHTFTFLLHVNSTISSSATINAIHVLSIESFNGDPEWQSVPYQPWNEVTNSSVVEMPFAAGGVKCCESLNVAGLSDVQIQGQPQGLTVPGILHYTVSVNLPSGYYEITFAYTITLADGSSTGSGASVPVTIAS